MATGWPTFNVSVTDLAESHLVALRGELDAVGAEYLPDQLMPITRPDIVVDLEGLTFIDAAGISALLKVKMHHEQQGHSLSLVKARGLVRRVFELADLAHLLAE